MALLCLPKMAHICISLALNDGSGSGLVCLLRLSCCTTLYGSDVTCGIRFDNTCHKTSSGSVFWLVGQVFFTQQLLLVPKIDQIKLKVYLGENIKASTDHQSVLYWVVAVCKRIITNDLWKYCIDFFMLYLADIWLIGLFLVKNNHKIDLGFVLWQFIIFKYLSSGLLK